MGKTDENKREQRYKLLTTGNLYPLLIRMAIPSMIGMIVSTVYNMTDTYWVAKLDDAALTASVGVVFTFVSVIQAIGFWFGYGSGNYISRMLGKKDNEKAEKMAAVGVCLAIITGIIFLLIGLILIRPLSVLLGAGNDEVLLDATIKYLRITVFSVPFMLVSNVLYNQLRLSGGAGSSMIGLLLGMGVNMILDPLFILSFNMGIEGAAYASLIGQVIGVAVLFYGTYKPGNVKVDLRKAKPDLFHIKEILAGGAPNFCRQGISSISSVVLNNVAGGFSVNALAAITIATRVLYIAYALVIGFGQGFQPVCAMNYGAKNYDRIKKAFKLTLITVTGFLVISTFVLILLKTSLIGAFTNEDEVALLAENMLEKWCVILPFMGYYILIGMLLQNIGRFALATSVTTLENGFCLIPVLLICSIVMGEDGLLWFKPIASGISLIISIFIGTYAWRKYLGGEKNAVCNTI